MQIQEHVSSVRMLTFTVSEADMDEEVWQSAKKLRFGYLATTYPLPFPVVVLPTLGVRVLAIFFVPQMYPWSILVSFLRYQKHKHTTQ